MTRYYVVRNREAWNELAAEYEEDGKRKWAAAELGDLRRAGVPARCAAGRRPCEDVWKARKLTAGPV
jgi:hypothetical protein